MGSRSMVSLGGRGEGTARRPDRAPGVQVSWDREGKAHPVMAVVQQRPHRG